MAEAVPLKREVTKMELWPISLQADACGFDVTTLTNAPCGRCAGLVLSTRVVNNCDFDAPGAPSRSACPDECSHHAAELAGARQVLPGRLNARPAVLPHQARGFTVRDGRVKKDRVEIVGEAKHPYEDEMIALAAQDRFGRSQRLQKGIGEEAVTLTVP